MYTVNGQHEFRAEQSLPALLDHAELRQLWTAKLTHEQECYDLQYQSRHPLEQALGSKFFHPKALTGLFNKVMF
jgi:hypothetical protein